MNTSSDITPGRSPAIGALAILQLLTVALLYGLLAYAGIRLTLESGRIAAFWIGNALVIGLLLGKRRSWQAAFLAACFATNCVANFAVGDIAEVAVGLAFANWLEMSTALYFLDRFAGRNESLATLSQFSRMAAFGLLTPVPAAFVAAAVLGSFTPADVSATVLQWLAAHCLPIPILGMMVLVVRNAMADPHGIERVAAHRWAAVLAAVAIGVPVIFAQTSYPFLFLAAPIVVFAAFLTGRLGTAIIVAIFACAAAAATILGSGPITLVVGGAREEVVALQAFLASSLAIGLPVAVVLANRTAIRAELKESHDFVNSILNGIGDLVFRVDADWRFTYLNPRWQEVTGYSSDELLGTTPFDRLLDHKSLDLRSAKAALERGEGTDDRYVVQTFAADGEVLQISIRLTAQFDKDRQFVGAIGTGTDVTESIARAHALAESEARFQTLANMAPAGIFRTSRDGACTYVNESWKTQTGLSDGEWEGFGWSKALHPKDAQRISEKWMMNVAAQTSDSDEFRWLRSDGSIISVHTVYGPEHDDNGEMTGFIGVVSDITDRRQAQDKLADREEQLALLADNATDAVLKLNLDGVCSYASPSAQQLFGLDYRQLIGHQFITGFHPDDQAQVQDTFERLASGEIDQARIAFRSRSFSQPDEFQWLEANCGVMRDAATGTPQEIIVSLRNIDETKRLESALLAARDRAEAAVEAKSAFLANMSHEIRTPMNGVIGFTEIALAGELDKEQRQNLEMIADSGRAMLRLLNDLLDFAKIEAGQMTLAREPTDLRHKLSGALRLMEPVAVQNGLSLEMDVDPEVPACIMSDPVRLRQIVLNLIGNALKFTEEGAVRVEVGPGASADVIEISVHDTGIGIPPDKLDFVFETFTQADSSIARRYGGTGLGLPICKQLAELMGGSIAVSSEVGVGSVFTLTLPMEPCAAPVRPEDTAGEEFSDDAMRAIRVLVAEDNAINQHLTLAMLNKAGCDAELVEDGEQAFARVLKLRGTNDAFDAVLMDMQMPNLDGLGATRKIRDAGIDAGELPIIALTANAYQEDIAACLQAGMQAHLAKPLRIRDLRATLGACTSHAKNGQGPAYEQESNPDLIRMFAERKKAALTQVDSALRRGALEGVQLDELVGQLHQIAGVAAFFGEQALGDQSSRMERELVEAENGDIRMTLLGQLRRLLAA